MLSNKLKYLMLQHGISSAELASATNIDKSTLSKILSGSTTNPRIDTIHTFAKYFNVSINELLENDYESELSLNEQPKNNTQNILRSLMSIHGISTISGLNKYTGISVSILSDLLSGKTQTPQIKTLHLLATFFNITVPQLTGLESIPRHKNSTVNLNHKSLPILSLDQTSSWLLNEFKDIEVYTTTSRANIGNKSYAINIKDDSFSPDFIKNQILIIDNEKQIEVNDYAICKIDNVISIFECLNLNNLFMELRQAGTNEGKNVQIQNVQILGTVIQQILNH